MYKDLKEVGSEPSGCLQEVFQAKEQNAKALGHGMLGTERGRVFGKSKV